MKSPMSPSATRNARNLPGKAKDVSRVLRGLAHPARLRILCRLFEGPASVRELEKACGLSQAQTSQFLARLRAEGQVRAQREGQFVRYSLESSQVAELIEAICRIYCKAPRARGRAA